MNVVDGNFIVRPYTAHMGDPILAAGIARQLALYLVTFPSRIAEGAVIDFNKMVAKCEKLFQKEILSNECYKLVLCAIGCVNTTPENIFSHISLPSGGIASCTSLASSIGCKVINVDTQYITSKNLVFENCSYSLTNIYNTNIGQSPVGRELVVLAGGRIDGLGLNNGSVVINETFNVREYFTKNPLGFHKDPLPAFLLQCGAETAVDVLCDYMEAKAQRELPPFFRITTKCVALIGLKVLTGIPVLPYGIARISIAAISSLFRRAYRYFA